MKPDTKTDIPETIALRYGVNIAEWDWRSRKTDREYCNGADPMVVNGEDAKSITLFAYEWQNTRVLGK